MNARETDEKNRIAKEDLAFWESRLEKRGMHAVDILQTAKAHLRLFGITGAVDQLLWADSLFRISSERVGHKDPDLLHTMAQTAITRHQFSTAFMYVEQASAVAGDPYVDRLVAFDTDMELGHFRTASARLQSIATKNTFDYLLRKAKLEDHRGNLSAAITLMEEATDKVKNNRPLYCWALSNLGDMYGHAGRIKDSYASYLAVLKTDPGYVYAWKGMAWIAFSHDRNTADAKRILQYISSQTSMPDIYLTLAEIAAWEGNKEESRRFEKQFLKIVTAPLYGDMYNKYLIDLFTGSFPDFERARQLAEKETTSRSTPETWSWLAWVLYHQGETEEAWAIMNNHVVDRTFEPEIQYKTAQVMIANGMKEDGKKLLKTCLESTFELGPVTEKNIRLQLESLK
jgi:tetratricopeptide (TPR) repeat protein